MQLGGDLTCRYLCLHKFSILVSQMFKLNDIDLHFGITAFWIESYSCRYFRSEVRFLVTTRVIAFLTFIDQFK